jgi:gas vesicle protein
MSDRDGDLGAFLAGVLVGGLMGAAAALMLAPQSGEETRTMIRERGIELKSRLEHAASDMKDRAEDALEEGKQRVDSAVDAARRATRRRRPDAESGTVVE